MGILVTGASKGIGAATAIRLAQDGHDIAIHYHNDREGAEATAHAVRGHGRNAILLPADLADPASARGVVEEAASGLDLLDGLVLNAGPYDRRSFEQMTPEAWATTMAIHLESPAAMVQAALPHLSARGAVVFVSSVAAKRGSKHGAHYTAAKAGIEGLTHALARELAPIRVNCVAPGYIATQILAGDDEATRRSREREVPLGRIGTPDEVATAIAFLIGPDAGYITGHVLRVDGGL